MRCKFESLRHYLIGGFVMKENKKDRKRKRAMQVVVVLLIAAVIITYSITFVGSFF